MLEPLHVVVPPLSNATFIQALQSHLQLSLHLHYGKEAYMISLHIMYWLMQQFLYDNDGNEMREMRQQWQSKR